MDKPVYKTNRSKVAINYLGGHMNNARNALVTGGAGFIGSNLCLDLISKGYRVTSLDNYFTGSKKNHHEGVDYIKGHTRDIKSLVKFIPDVIYHLGEYSRVEQSFEDVDVVWESNRVGTLAVLQFALGCGAKLVYAGSSTKYGDDGRGSSQSPYAWSKSSNTELVLNYGKWFGLNYAIVYFYNVYGKNEISSGKYATVIAYFKKRMQEKSSLTVVSPGNQIRNFTYIDDIVRGLSLVGEKGFGDEFGIGSDEGYSILEIAEMFDGPVQMLPERKGNRMSATVVTDKTKALGWTCHLSVKDYISELRNNFWIEP
jgi:UDP-glucose 4-epimerase